MNLLNSIAVLLLGCSLCFATHGHQARRGRVPRQSAASVALFVNSNPDSARALAARALRQNPQDVDALFVEMEAAALEADTAGELDAALRLCETNANDARTNIAAARVLDLAGNTLLFRSALPRLQKLVAAADTGPAASLRLALVAAAAEGARGLSLQRLAQQAGLLTDWQLAGPFGRYASIAFERGFAPERDGLSQPSYDGHAVERFRFDDGTFNLADYLSQNGVYYAASAFNAPADGTYQLRVESAGTLEVFIDGRSALRKDDRLRAGAEVIWSAQTLTAGTHHVLVKFVPMAAPFRIALLPERSTKHHPGTAATGPEAAYVSAEERFWMGDYNSAIAQLSELRRQQPSSAVDLLLAHAWSQMQQDAPEIPFLLESARKQSPLAMAAEFEIAQRAYEAERNEEAYKGARRVAEAQPDFAPARQLLADAAMRLDWPAEAAQAFESALRLHPSCSTLRSAARFFASTAAYGRAAQLEEQLDGCAPGSLAYAQALSKAGRHGEAAAALQKLIAEQPLDRDAHAMVTRELASAGEALRAAEAKAALAALAPNASLSRMLEGQSARARAFTDEAFYQPYRRNGLDVIHQTSSRTFSGGPAVIVLEDKVASLDADGAVALYVHRITRVLNRDGIEKYGEVTLPASAELLELRTVKKDGTVVEPEFSQHKSTVSMPALAPGDAIEQEYVVRSHEGGLGEHGDAFAHTFGSFDAPVLYTRFVTITPDASTEVVSSAVPGPQQTQANGTTVRVWEQQNLDQWAQEVSAPPRGTLPNVHLVASSPGGWRDLRDLYRDELLSAAQSGPRVDAAAHELHGATAEDTARSLYRMVTTRIRSTDNTFDGGVTSAEDTLANYAGSRTTVLLALARASGLNAELLLARDMARPRPATAEANAYSHPLVLFHFAGRDTVADAETAGLAFGVVPPTLSHEDALLVPLRETAEDSLMVALPASAGDELSVAEGDVTFDVQGNLRARLTIRMGASRGSQMRSILSGIDPSGRRHFFEQLALRIFPGVSEASGEVQNEFDAELPLRLIINCRAPRFLTFNGSLADVEQLAPALGLRKMYGLGSRRLPLYVDMPLIETTVFHVHLPEGFKLAGRASDLRVTNEFGSYTLEFKEVAPGNFDVRRAFRIPVQVIAPERFGAFASFARQIDDAERQRLTIGAAAVTTASQ